MVNTRIVSVSFDCGDGALPVTVTVSGTAVIGFNTGGTRMLNGPSSDINIMLLNIIYFFIPILIFFIFRVPNLYLFITTYFSC